MEGQGPRNQKKNSWKRKRYAAVLSIIRIKVDGEGALVDCPGLPRRESHGNPYWKKVLKRIEKRELWLILKSINGREG